MSVTLNNTADIVKTGQSVALSSLVNVTAAANDPTYLMVVGLDRNEYTTGASTATGAFNGNGNTEQFVSQGGDSRGNDVIFTYQAGTGRYYNSIYGYFDQATYTASTANGDVTNLSFVATNSLNTAQAYTANSIITNPVGYLGSATIVSASNAVAVPTQATPSSITSAALSFVGQTWNQNGCWVLASDIAAHAGAGLPVSSSVVGLPGQANGEWFVAFNGPAGATGNWQNMVTAGEIISIGLTNGAGHITTCVSGSGLTAQLVDNAQFGSGTMVTIAAPHAASQEWAQVSGANSVTIYELDCPIVTAGSVSKVMGHSSIALTSLVSVADPNGKAIVDYQVYDTSTTDSITVNGTNNAAHTVATAVNTTSLSGVCLAAGTTACTDVIEVRAENALGYWGDWNSVTLAVSATASPPTVNVPTAAQTWNQGAVIAFALPSNTFVDPNGQTLTYAATQLNGQALPSWLHFNASTETFTGTVPGGMETLNLTVTATDTSGLTTSETFGVNVPAAAPTILNHQSNLTYSAGTSVKVTIPATSFLDPNGQNLTLAVTQSNGAALPSWLTFNSSTDVLSGTAPTSSQSLNLSVIATDTSHLSVSEGFTISVTGTPATTTTTTTTSPSTNTPPLLQVNTTPDQTWTPGHAMSFTMPANTFVDNGGTIILEMATEVSGPSVSWMSFNSNTHTFSGTVPTSENSGVITLQVIGIDSRGLMASDIFHIIL